MQNAKKKRSQSVNVTDLVCNSRTEGRRRMDVCGTRRVREREGERVKQEKSIEDIGYCDYLGTIHKA